MCFGPQIYVYNLLHIKNCKQVDTVHFNEHFDYFQLVQVHGQHMVSTW